MNIWSKRIGRLHREYRSFQFDNLIRLTPATSFSGGKNCIDKRVSTQENKGNTFITLIYINRHFTLVAERIYLLISGKTGSSQRGGSYVSF